MATSLPATVAKKRVLPHWMLIASANPQHAHTTVLSLKKQKKRDIIDSFFGPPTIKHRIPLQDVSNNERRRIDYLKEKQREHRCNESQDKAERLRNMREYAQRARSIHNESADHREGRLDDQRHYSAK
uniref:Uncharacterized protein n=1 Tax=Amphimedon queenslandica TaxID=400682 RepID=A0A1X7U991_AMPQE